MEPTTIFWLILVTIWLLFIWDFYMGWRQYRVHRDNAKRPDHVSEIITEEEYNKARAYKLDKHLYGFVTHTWSHLQTNAVLLLGLLPFFWSISGNISEKIYGKSEIFQSIVFASLTSIIETLIGIPFELFDTFVIEEKHGFNKQTLGFFIKDHIKKVVVSLVIMTPIVAGIIWIVNAGGDYFFFYLWIFISLVVFVMLMIYPEFIAPLFDKYTPLPESELKKKIEALAAKLQFPLTKLYVVEGSKRSAHSNAYMYGFWKNKRIVLFDTLLSEEMRDEVKKLIEAEKAEKAKDKKPEEETINKEATEKKSEEENTKEHKKLGMNDDEVVAVLGHELGHWKLWHTVSNLIISEANLLFLLYIFAYFYRQKSLYLAFGFNTQPTLIGLVIVFQMITAPYNELVSFLVTIMSRKMEFAADRFSAELGYAKLLCSALIKLGKDNLSLPIDDPLYSMVHHSHPPIPERMAAMKKYI